MQRTLFGLIAMVVLLTAIGSRAENPPGVAAAAANPSRIATIYKHDPITQHISLKTGKGGHVVQKHAVSNHQSDLDFGNYNRDAFTAGIEGGRRGRIIDLGDAAQLSQRYRYAETVGGGQGYASIRFVGQNLVIRTRQRGATQPMKEQAKLMAPIARGNKQGTAPVRLGHVYLVRITDRNNPAFDRIAKLLVISHDADEYVTFRGDLLRDVGGR